MVLAVMMRAAPAVCYLATRILMSSYDVLDGSCHGHCDVPIRDSDSLKPNAILAFSERLLLAEAVEEVPTINILETMIQKVRRA